MRITVLPAAAMLAFLALASGASAQTVIKIAYTTTVQLAAGDTQHETGSYYFARDGYRLDRIVNGERTSMFIRNGQRVEINHDLGVAVRGPSDGTFRVPTMESTGERVVTGRRAAALRSRLVNEPTDRGPTNREPIDTTYRQEDLGTRALGPLLLHGIRHTFEPRSAAGTSRVAEHWLYVRPDGLPEGIEESETVYTAAGNVLWSRIKSVVSAQRIERDPGMFDVPDGIRVQEHTR